MGRTRLPIGAQTVAGSVRLLEQPARVGGVLCLLPFSWKTHDANGRPFQAQKTERQLAFSWKKHVFPNRGPCAHTHRFSPPGFAAVAALVADDRSQLTAEASDAIEHVSLAKSSWSKLLSKQLDISGLQVRFAEQKVQLAQLAQHEALREKLQKAFKDLESQSGLDAEQDRDLLGDIAAAAPLF